MSELAGRGELTLRCATRIVESAHTDWNYELCFNVPPNTAVPPQVPAAANLQRQAKIFRHPFFELARTDREAIRIWAAQEAVVTGTFSQLLLLVASQMRNVHQRAAILEVAVGEHGKPGAEGADQSHPWLLHLLCESLDLKSTVVVPIPPTVRFLDALASTTPRTLAALGAFGVGNELMLIPEYTAIKKCFESCYPEAAYADFLMANIEEDTEHVRIVESLAASLMATGEDPDEYVEGARIGVNARIAYYDELTEYISSR